MEEKGKQRTELNEIGEFGLIERIKKRVSHLQETSLTGIGDDAAVIDAGDSALIVTTDLLLEGIHFDLAYTPLKHLGYKAVAVNISDIAAMNAIPAQITISIGLSNRFSVEAVDELYEGVLQACENYKVDLIGGDTTSSLTGLIISVTAIGNARKEQITYRSKAGEGDLICVTGDLGGAFMGLQLMEREKQEFLANPEMQPQLEGKDYVVGRLLRPEARMDMVHELGELKIRPTSMMDISDGLASDLLHICNASGKGARVYEDKLPIDNSTYETAREFNLDPVTCVLNGGEDYELLFTIRQEDFPKLRNHPDITVIGHITSQKDGVNLVTKESNMVPVTAQGWVHFSSK